jgi:ribosomal protein S18 acetylase RimI-like enzyme
MIKSLDLRLMTTDDLLFADHLRALEGWNQRLEDWRRYLMTEPNGCFVAVWNGVPAGTVIATIYGQELGWIGMLLVHPDFRRRGIGTELLKVCIKYLRGRNVRCIKLDATPAGKAVYDALGFKDEWTLSRWEGIYAPPPHLTPDLWIRKWQKTDIAMVDRIDAEAFGISRNRVLQALAHESLSALVLESKPGRILGYGLLREGSRAMQIGPVVAASSHSGIHLIEALLLDSRGQRIFWDIPDRNTATIAWVKHQSFTVQRSLTRMYLGENSMPSDPQKYFALAGPELG